MGIVEQGYSHLFFRRAAQKVWLTYKINKAETKTLLMIAAAMHARQAKTITLEQLKRLHTGNLQDISLNGPVYGLMTKGPLQKVIYNKTHETWIFTQMAYNIFKTYEEEYLRIVSNVKTERVRPIPNYKLDDKPPIVEEMGNAFTRAVDDKAA